MEETRLLHENFCFSFVFPFVQVVLFWRIWGEGDVVIPPLCRHTSRPGVGMGIPEEKVVCLEGQRQVAAIALRAPCSGIEIQDGYLSI